MNQLKWFFDSFISLIIPVECPVCCSAVFGTSPVCKTCNSQIVLFSDNRCHKCGVSLHDSAASICYNCSRVSSLSFFLIPAAPYHSPLKDMILAYKFSGATSLGNYLSQFVIDSILRDPRIDSDWHVAPVPMFPSDLSDRGYNQSEILAQNIAKGCNLKLIHNPLKKIKKTPLQASLSRSQRKKNLLDAFAANPSKVAGKKILIVDDIVTTGATISACSKALEKAGAVQTAAASIAYSVPKTADQIPLFT